MTWIGVTATYGPREQRVMQDLHTAGATRDELATLHTLIGLFAARLAESGDTHTLRSERT